MDIGTGIATGATAVGFTSVIITAIVKLKRSNNIYVRKDVCSERVQRLEHKIDAVANDISEIKEMIKNGR